MYEGVSILAEKKRSELLSTLLPRLVGGVHGSEAERLTVFSKHLFMYYSPCSHRVQVGTIRRGVAAPTAGKVPHARRRC